MKLENVLKIQKELETQVLELSGVSGVDSGFCVVDGRQTKEFCIRIYVEDLAAAKKNLYLPEEYKGVKIELIERTFELH